MPWALRHAHHARETDLLRVNGQTLNMQTVMGYLDWLWQDAALVTGLVDGCLVREAVEIRGIGASDGEVRAAMLGFRREQGLDSGAATDGWLRRRGWTRDDLEHECRRQVIAGKLRAQIAAGRVRSYFARHRGQFDTAAIARLRLADRDAARRIARRIKPGGIEFTRTLEETILARPAGTATSTFETVRRRDLAAAHARAIFGAPLGGVIGPMRGADGYDVLRVLRIARARLDRPTRELIEQVLFEEWLATRRAEATVEWFWGDAERAVTRAGSARRPR